MVNLLDQTANFQIEQFFLIGFTGLFRRATETSRLVDLAATLSVNLMEAPTFSAEEFSTLDKNPRPILAAGLKLVAPAGDYDDTKLINIGSNRWGGA